jgi:hypothetical protein
VRFKNVNRNCGDGTSPASVQHAQLAVLMDIRDELQRLNELLHCENVAKAARAIIRAERRIAKQVKLP